MRSTLRFSEHVEMHKLLITGMLVDRL